MSTLWWKVTMVIGLLALLALGVAGATARGADVGAWPWQLGGKFPWQGGQTAAPVLHAASPGEFPWQLGGQVAAPARDAATPNEFPWQGAAAPNEFPWQGGLAPAAPNEFPWQGGLASPAPALADCCMWPWGNG